MLLSADWKSLLLACLVGLVGSLYVVVYLLSHSPRAALPEELVYITIDETGQPIKRSLEHDGDERRVVLSVIIPSYNETTRIKNMLSEAIAFLEDNFKHKWEIIIVDDGSKDGTTNYCLQLAHEQFQLLPDQLKVIKLVKNRGKGGAVKQGLIHAKGSYGLFADADGASKFSDVQKLLSKIQDCESADAQIPAVAIGSRAHMVNTDAVVKRSFIRNLLMYGLHTLVFLFGIRSIKDTQCGFKLFNKRAIDLIFPYMHTEGWIFDVEILMLAIRKKIPVQEVPISWHEVDGSKMDLARDSINMAKDLVVIRMAYLLGIYQDNKRC